MDKVKEQQDGVAPTREEAEEWQRRASEPMRPQRELQEEIARREAIIKQQSEALQHAENEILRLRAELYEYYKMVIQNQHQQIQELSAPPDSG